MSSTSLDRDIVVYSLIAMPLISMNKTDFDFFNFNSTGRSYCITSHRMLMQCIDSLVQKVQSGVVINFEKIGPDPPPIDGVTNKDGEPDEVIHEPEKEMDVDGDRNGVRRNIMHDFDMFQFKKYIFNVLHYIM